MKDYKTAIDFFDHCKNRNNRTAEEILFSRILTSKKAISNKILLRLRAKNRNREAKIETERNKARLNYPVDVRIDLAMKNIREGESDFFDRKIFIHSKKTMPKQ